VAWRLKGRRALGWARRSRAILVTRSSRRPGSSSSKPVTHAAHGLEPVSFRSELAPQRADRSLDDVAAFVVGPPDGAEDLVAAGHCASTGEEELCQRELDPGQRYPPAVDDQLACLGVEEAGVVDSELARGQARQPAVDRAGAEVQPNRLKGRAPDVDRLERHEAELDHDGQIRCGIAQDHVEASKGGAQLHVGALDVEPERGLRGRGRLA